MLMLKEKMEIVCLLDKEKLSVRDIVKKFKIGKTQAAKIIKDKEKIRKKWQSGVSVKTKKNFLSSEGSKIDKACFEWFVKAKNQNNGKSARPRALKNVAPKDLPAIWKSNKKAWMTRDIMTEWLSNFDKNMVSQLLSKIDFAESASKLSKSIDILESLYFIKSAWQKVTPKTIRNCFKKAGFLMDQGSSTDSNYDVEDNLPLARLADLFKCSKRLGIDNVKTPEEYLTVDQNVDIEDNDLEFSVVTKNVENETEEEENEEVEVEEDEERNPITSYKEALNVISKLKSFVKNDFTAFQHVKNLETHIERSL
ncbi:tigger transposable element-derived protein 6-like [Onthophagus taurus]|uniref:tigger transposable element-derived protein 6-like n=1 Tax=Onthophagus taurus TaxID=166361 RepID=UPI0039BE64DD